MKRWALLCFVCLFTAAIAPVLLAQTLSPCAGTGPGGEVGYLECRVLPVPHVGDWTSGSGYTALISDLNGNAYIGAANYGFSASLVQYRADTGEFRLIARMHDLFHFPFDGTAIDTQSKIHTKLCRDAEGRIYGGTKQGNEEFGIRPEFDDPKGYPAGHLFVYDPKTDVIKDLGANPLPHEGFEGGAIDQKRGRLYYNSCPKHNLIIYDIPSGRFINKGEIDSSSRYNVVDPKGHAFWPGFFNDLVMYDPETDDVYQIHVNYKGPGEYQTFPYAFCLGPDGTKMYGHAGGEDIVQEYDLNTLTNDSISCRGVCPTVPEGFKNTDIHTMLSGPDGRVYWTAEASDTKNVLPLGVHLMRYDPVAQKAEDLGILRDSNSSRWNPPHIVTQIQGSAFAPDGTLYLKQINVPYALIIVPKEVCIK